MPVKSQQDIKNATKEKSDKIPKSMEKQERQVIVKPQETKEEQKDQTDKERLAVLEKYCSNVDLAFAKFIAELNVIKEELATLKGLIPIVQRMDTEISKLTGDNIRMTSLEEDRYLELANAINRANEKIDILDKSIPSFVDDKINDYFEEIAALDQEEPSEQEESK